MLGDAQEDWLDGELAASTARWNVIAQQTVMTAMPIPVGDVTFFNFDQWDGYVAARERLLRSLVDRGVANPMVLSGDIHLAAAAAVRLDYDDPEAPDVAQEIVATSISSRFDPALLDIVSAGLSAAPWTRYANAERRGYALVTVTPNEWRTEFRTVDVTTETSTVATDFVDVVTARAPVVVPPDDPGGPGGPGDPGATGEPGDGTTPRPPEASAVAGRPAYTG